VAWVPLEFFGFCVEDWFRVWWESQHGQGGIGQRGKDRRESGAFCPVAIFVPPAILDEVEVVFNLPVTTYPTHQIKRRKGATDQDASQNIAAHKKEFRLCYCAGGTCASDENDPVASRCGNRASLTRHATTRRQEDCTKDDAHRRSPFFIDRFGWLSEFRIVEATIQRLNSVRLIVFYAKQIITPLLL